MKTLSHLFAGIALATLAACGPPEGTLPGAGFPPFGEEASKIWLEEQRQRARAVAGPTAPATLIVEELILDPDLPAPVIEVEIVPEPVPATVALVAPAPAVSLDATGAAALFVQVCLQTTQNPAAAAGILQSLGFRETATQGNQVQFAGPGARATLYRDGPNGGFGQCVITPTGIGYTQALPAFRAAVTASGIPVEPSPNRNAYLIRNTGALAVISRAGPALTRTTPGVFRN